MSRYHRCRGGMLKAFLPVDSPPCPDFLVRQAERGIPVTQGPHLLLHFPLGRAVEVLIRLPVWSHDENIEKI